MKVGLFIPCYINAVYPEVGIACYKLLKSLDVDVDYPLGQTCCGQPMANAGFEHQSLTLAERFDQLFSEYSHVVGPSASCVAFVRKNYPALFQGKENSEDEESHTCTVSNKVYDITEFLYDIVQPTSFASHFPHVVSIHNSCHGVRELGLSSPSELTVPYYSKVRALLEKVSGITVCEPQRVDECCGFGGMFCVEEPEVSACMGRDKVKDHMSTGAEFITGTDNSCLMHMQGIIARENYPIRTIHVLEILTAQL